MSKLVQLLDFQVYARPTGLAEGEQRSINEALFATYEPVRLWLKEHEVKAPFRKIVVSLADESSSGRWHGNVSNAIGICEVTEAVDLHVLGQSAGDHRWVLGIVEHALSCIAGKTSWRSGELEAFIRAAAERMLQLPHFFENLARLDRVSGVRCVPWISTRPGETRLGVRLVSKDNVERDVTVLSKPGPLYLEDTFPMAKSVIRPPDFVLLDRAGNTLASVPINNSELH